MNNQEISVKAEINALHLEVHSLLLLAKVTNQDFNGTPWTNIINMAYQAEYIIDLYLASSSRDLGLISSLSTIIEQLKNIRANVHGLSSKSLPTQDAAATSRPHVHDTTTQTRDNHAIVSFQEESIIKEYILNGENELDFISIIGMAGVGKTTLASTLYNTSSVGNHFDMLAWCTISQSYQNRDVLLTILDQCSTSGGSHRSIVSNEELADQLCRRLKKRRYLIVLDDIWDAMLWNFLKRFLPDDRIGSRILITTRNGDVADQIGGKVNELHGLSEKTSWELFQKKLLEKESLSDNLLKISKEIVGNCKGLPLSIVIIAGILTGMERTVKKWNQIAESLSSVILSDPHGQCKAILELSYNQLPNHLRSCFLYMGSFPEDKEILLDHLINLWIAEGFVRETKLESAEEVAEKYMKDLIVKSLVIPVKEISRGGVKTFRLHDLLRDFCLDKAKEKHFFTMLGRRDDSLPLQDPRRLIINDPLTKERHFSCHSIRSMICFGLLDTPQINMEIGSGDMVLLKVLDVIGLWLNNFPDLSSLVHLRYLALCLQSPNIAVLPSSISKLQNLQFLILDCGYVIEVPDFIWDMVKLKHIDISPKASFQVDSNRVRNSSLLLQKLRSLSKAHVSIGDSKSLSKLSGLQTLCCIFVGGDLRVDDDDLQEDEENGLQMLSFNGHLSSLSMEGRKQRFVSTCQLPISLRELSLSRFILTLDDISGIGKALPLLEVFEIFSCYIPDRNAWNVDDEDFPELKILKLRDLKISKWIASENSFPSLEQLWLEKCDYLDEIPLDFGSLPNLRLISVRDCETSVDNSTREIEKQQHEELNTEMRVRIYPKRNLSIPKAKYLGVHGHRNYFHW